MAPRDGGSARGAGETGDVVDDTLVGPPDARAMAVTDGAGAVTSDVVSRIITASILHFKEHTTYCLRLSTATGA